VVVTADGFAHGHEKVACALRWRGPGQDEWNQAEMEALGNDRWQGAFTVDRIGAWQYAVSCWVDHLASWREGFLRRIDPADVRLAARMGAELVAQSAARAQGYERDQLARLASLLSEEQEPVTLRRLVNDEALFALARKHAAHDGVSETMAFPLTVERERARFSSWYELFPRSASEVPGKHGTFADVEERLDEIAAMGFNVVYLPPIHPIGREKRKGRNNVPLAEPGDVGSPWGIGASEGGHTAIIKPWPLRPAVAGGFTLDEFAVDETAGTVTCPNQVTRPITRTRAVAFGAACRGCPLRARCTSSAGISSSEANAFGRRSMARAGP
jgi:starch synthase (maltosyl-transferring)